MKLSTCAITALLGAFGITLHAQGTFIYDQQSSTNEAPPAFGEGVLFQQFQPYGESFRPTLQTLDFVRLKFNDGNFGNGLGGTLYVNVRAGSLSGAIVGSSLLAILPDSFGGTVDFIFQTPVALVPDSTYFIEPLVQSGDTWRIIVDQYGYSGGNVFYNGTVSQVGTDLWFREGVLVPEPSALGLVIVGGALALWHCKNKRQSQA
jgi:hypothetical protein